MVHYLGKAGRFQAKNTWVGFVLPDTLRKAKDRRRLRVSIPFGELSAVFDLKL